MSGNIVLGQYSSDPTHGHNFIYDGSTFTTLDDDPMAIPGTTSAVGISAGTIVGGYDDATAGRAFIYKDGTFTTLTDPASPGPFPGPAYATGISGNIVIG